MYTVEWKNVNSGVSIKECSDLSAALAIAKELNQFVTIQCEELILVGVFGVDSVNDSICPDGIEYSWKKRRK